MGSKYRLLPWVHSVIAELRFSTALDAFSGSGCVSYLLKSMGKEVVSNDFLRFPCVISKALIENQTKTLTQRDLEVLVRSNGHHEHFIEKTFAGIFFTKNDLRFLDRVWANLPKLPAAQRSVALAALIRSCVKRQPRGVFTVAGDPARYKDGRRDVMLSIEAHFAEQIEVYNTCVFDNGRRNRSLNRDVFQLELPDVDLVYLDPPYVPRSDDNCYIKRYHFLEGLSCYWRNLEIIEASRVRKIAKRFTPFSYRRTAVSAFDRLFSQFKQSTIVLSYSSNGFPDLEQLIALLKRHKRSVSVFERDHTYHFGTHDAVKRAQVREYLVVGTYGSHVGRRTPRCAGH
jgi:DNA adenine methylase/adenine-specific DNA-methyltransferase